MYTELFTPSSIEQVADTGKINDSDSLDLSTFAQRGGKLIVVHGTSDPVFSVQDTIDWYEQMKKYNQQDFSRLFLVPGMNHCGGGNALSNIDVLTTMEDWKKTNIGPEQIAGTGKYLPGVTQPICAYPKQAFYIKGQDPKKITSYRCK